MASTARRPAPLPLRPERAAVPATVRLRGHPQIPLARVPRGKRLDVALQELAALLRVGQENVRFDWPPGLDLEEAEVQALVSQEMPALSQEPMTFTSLSGATTEVAPGLPAPLVYAQLAAQLGCSVGQLRLLYPCAKGCESHRLRALAHCPSTGGRASVVVQAA